METLPFSILKDLVDIPSSSGNENVLAEYITDFFNLNSIPVKKIPVGSNYNIFVGKKINPTIVFNTHMDTVEPFLPFSVKGDVLYGRGVLDAKGIIFAMMSAYQILNSLNVGILFTVGEEKYSIGAKKMKEYPEYSSDFLVCGEPTNQIYYRGQKGVMILRIKSHAASAHSSVDQDNAIHNLLDLLHDLATIDLPNNCTFGKTTLNIGKISGGNAANISASSATADLFYRLTVPYNEINSILENTIKRYPNINYRVLSQTNPMNFFIPNDNEVNPLAPFATDIPYLAQFGKPILLGPGDIKYAHTENEQVTKQELCSICNKYVQLARQLLSF